MEYADVIEKAFGVMKNSYSPYSKFPVGACLQTNDGHYFVGTNIENAAYGSTMCAERNAVYSAYCQGYRKDDIMCLAIVGQGDILISPCGACRQVLVELLNPECPIILASKDEVQVMKVAELMPNVFIGENLKCSNQDL